MTADEASGDADGGVIVPFPIGATDPDEFPDTGPNSLPSLGQRSLARGTDFFLSMILPAGAITFLLRNRVDEEGLIDISLELALALSTLVLLIPVVYETVLVSGRGQTVGKIMGGMRVAAVDTGDTPTTRQAAIRILIPIAPIALGVVIPFISLGYFLVYLSAVFGDRLRRGWHDKAAGTVVVRTR